MKLKHYLIASEENDYKPWITTKTALACFILIVWGIRLAVPISMISAQSTIDATDVMNRINTERTNRFIPALSTNTKLVTAATAKAGDMISRSYFAHVDPDGKYVWPRIVAAGYSPYIRLGENLAMDFVTASGVVSGWMNSPTHRANIINDKFEDQGLAATYGTYEANHDTIIVVSLFGTLQESTPAPQPSATPPPASTPTPPKPTTPTQKPVQAPLSVTPTPESSTPNEPEDSKVAQTIPPQGLAATLEDETIPVSSEAQTMKIIRLIFGSFALLYMIFLGIDSIIIHKARLKRDRIPSSPNTLLLLLIAAASFLSALI